MSDQIIHPVPAPGAAESDAASPVQTEAASAPAPETTIPVTVLALTPPAIEAPIAPMATEATPVAAAPEPSARAETPVASDFTPPPPAAAPEIRVAAPTLVQAMMLRGQAWLAQARTLAPAPSSMARIGLYAAVALAFGAAGAGVFGLVTHRGEPSPAILAARTDARLARLAEDVRTLRDTVAGLAKGVRPRGADELKPVQDRVAALGETIDRLRQDQGKKANDLVGAVERVEKLDREAAARLAQIAERLDRIERQTAPLTTGSVSAPAAASAQSMPAPASPAPVASIPVPPARPVEKPAVTAVEQTRLTKPVEGWALRDVYDGLALVESRRLGLLEVAPGQTVRGLGRIEKIERRGRQWVVVTEQGLVVSN